jgi:hypothetical protein
MIAKDIEFELSKAAQQFGVPLPILVGLAMAESSGQWALLRHEPNYRWVWDVKLNKPFRKLTVHEAMASSPPSDFPYYSSLSNAKSEWINQRTSFGPLQVMGAVARELGFIGNLNNLLYKDGIFYGAKHFANLFDRFFDEHNISGVVSAYNCGRPDPSLNQVYVNKVLATAERYINSQEPK